MIALVQRVSEASVRVDGNIVGAIGHGLLVLVCAEPADTALQAQRLVDKLLKLRIFGDDAGKMNRRSRPCRESHRAWLPRCARSDQ